MKRNVLFRLIFIYLFLSVSLFVLLNTFAVNKTKSQLINEKQTQLYEEAQFISKEYLGLYYQNQMTETELTSRLGTIDRFSDTQLWLVNCEGLIIMDTRTPGIINQRIDVSSINEHFLDFIYLENVTLKNVLDEPMLSVIFPITREYGVRGYLVIHSSMAQVTQDAIKYTDIINICLLVSLLILLAVFIYLYFLMIRPLHLCIQAAKQFSNGHFEYETPLKRSDEYGELIDTISYMSTQLRNLDEYQRNFIANVSHDFRSPLTSIKGYAEALKDGTIPFELKDKYLDIIAFEADRLTKLTTGLLELNQFDQNGTVLHLSSFDINSMIKQTCAAFEGACTKKHIKFKLQFDSVETYVTADFGKIQQVLYNLIDNAIKFSHNDSNIYVITEEKNEKICVSVKDSGIGIPTDSLLKIWDRFYKTDASRGKDKKGVGLGLSITKEIIQSHKENITVTSTEGVGTTFSFTLEPTPEEDEV